MDFLFTRTIRLFLIKYLFLTRDTCLDGERDDERHWIHQEAA